MKFAIRLLVGGIGAAAIGLWWSIDGMTDGSINKLFGGLLWKGPLLFVAGVGASVMGFRMIREIRRREAGTE